MNHEELLAEAMAALAEAAEEERPMRIGHDVARVLHAALLDATTKPHEHAWHSLGWDRPSGGVAYVIQACACGDVRSVAAGGDA